MSLDECRICGLTENLQMHHVSYEPEIVVTACVDCHNKLHPRHGVGTAKGVKRAHRNKIRVTFTIERTLLNKLDNYVKKRRKLLGETKTKTSIVEEGLENILYRLEREISGLEGRDLSVIR